MKVAILLKLVGMILKQLTPDLLKTFADKILDFGENYVLGTKSKLDDAFFLPAFLLVRKTFDVPDDDDQALLEVDSKVNELAVEKKISGDLEESDNEGHH